MRLISPMMMMIFQNTSRKSGKTATVSSVPITTSRVGSVYGVVILKRDAITIFQLAILQNRMEEAFISTLPLFLWHMLLYTPSYTRPAPSKTRQGLSSKAKHNCLERRDLRMLLQGFQVQQFLKPKLVQLFGPTFITVCPTIAYCGCFP